MEGLNASEEWLRPVPREKTPEGPVGGARSGGGDGGRRHEGVAPATGRGVRHHEQATQGTRGTQWSRQSARDEERRVGIGCLAAPAASGALTKRIGLLAYAKPLPRVDL